MVDKNLYFDTSAANNLDSIDVTDPTIATPLNVKDKYLFRNAITNEHLVGTMPLNDPESIEIVPESSYIQGETSYTIPKGYHYGTGKVYSKKLSDYTYGTATAETIQKNKTAWVNGERVVGTLDIEAAKTEGTATAGDIVDGKTAWVNGVKLTGTIPVLPRVDKTLLAGESYTPPSGLSSGTSVITAASLASQTAGTAVQSDISYGETAWVNGEKVIGTLNIAEEIARILSETDALKTNVLSGKKFYSSKYDTVVTGAMPDYSGSAQVTIPIGSVYNIPEGYHNGNSITTRSLAQETEGTAQSNHIVSNKTAWVNGVKVTGSMTYNEATTTSIEAEASYTIPEGYHTGNGKVVAKSIKDQTQGTATEDNILYSKTAWVNGNKITGSMPNNEPIYKELNPGEVYYIPVGYHTGAGNVWIKDFEDLTAATADKDDIILNKTAWVNGNKLTGTIVEQEIKTVRIAVGHQYTLPAGYYRDGVTIYSIETDGILDLRGTDAYYLDQRLYPNTAGYIDKVNKILIIIDAPKTAENT